MLSLTCRKRRVKCDEERPRCKNCGRLDRGCVYIENPTTPPRPRPLNARKISDTTAVPNFVPTNCQPENDSPVAPAGGLSSDPGQSTQPWIPFPTKQPEFVDSVIPDDNFFLDDSLFTFGDTLTPNFGPVEWYDLLAEDAINSMQEQTHSNRWNFDVTSLSRRHTPRQSHAPELGGITFDDENMQVCESKVLILF